MSGMLPGLFENGGVYCHATGFKILMDCKVGRASKALQTLKKIMPDSEKNPSSRSGAEPYVFYQLLLYTSRILRKVLSVLDYRNICLVPDGNIRRNHGCEEGL